MSARPPSTRLAWPQSRVIRRLIAVARGLRNAGRAIVRRFGRRPRRPGPHTILITGAAAGVGLELARLLRDTHHRLVLTARAGALARFAEAELVAGPRLKILPLDVTMAQERERVIAEIERDWGGVDVLVNNAAVSYRGVAEHVSPAEALGQLQTNYLGPMELVRRVLPHMRRQRFGRIINVSSVGGMTAMPTMSVYSASKFALEGASEALWYEVRPWGIHVSLVQPGFINSDGFRKVRYAAQGARALADEGDPYHAHYQHMTELIEALMMLTFHDSRDVAETIAEVIESRNPPLRVAGTWDAYVFGLLRRFVPRGLYHRLLYALLPRVWEWGQSEALFRVRPPTGSAAVPAVHEDAPIEPRIKPQP